MDNKDDSDAVINDSNSVKLCDGYVPQVKKPKFKSIFEIPDYPYGTLRNSKDKFFDLGNDMVIKEPGKSYKPDFLINSDITEDLEPEKKTKSRTKPIFPTEPFVWDSKAGLFCHGKPYSTIPKNARNEHYEKKGDYSIFQSQPKK